MKRRSLLAAGAAALAVALGGANVAAQETVKIGLILPMTGPFASTGRQIEAAAKLYMQQKGDTVAGKKLQLIVKDDTGVADVTKRLAQELIVNDKVTVLAGFGLTPLALATASAGDAGEGADRGHGGSDLDHHRGIALHRAHELHGRSGDGSARRMGDARTTSSASSRWSPITAPASTSRRRSPRPSPRPAARSRTCACRSQTRTSRPSFRRSPTRSPTPFSPSCRRASARSS